MELVNFVVGCRRTFLAFKRESNSAAADTIAIVATATAVVVASFATAHIAATIAANTAATIAITARYLGVLHSKDPPSLLPHPLEVYVCHSLDW